MNQPEREGEKDNRPLKGSPDSEQSQVPPEGGRSLEAQARPQGWLQTQALSAQMSVSSKHANRCLVEERNCRKITTPAVTSPTEPKTAHPSHALCLQMDFPSTLRGLEMGQTLAWGGVPGGGQAQNSGERGSPPDWICGFGGESQCVPSTAPMTPRSRGRSPGDPGQGVICPPLLEWESQAGGV